MNKMLSRPWLKDIVTILARAGFAVLEHTADESDAKQFRQIQDELLKDRPKRDVSVRDGR